MEITFFMYVWNQIFHLRFATVLKENHTKISYRFRKLSIIFHFSLYVFIHTYTFFTHAYASYIIVYIQRLGTHSYAICLEGWKITELFKIDFNCFTGVIDHHPIQSNLLLQDHFLLKEVNVGTAFGIWKISWTFVLPVALQEL